MLRCQVMRNHIDIQTTTPAAATAAWEVRSRYELVADGRSFGNGTALVGRHVD
jgi:hypothetical protein